MDFQFNFEKYIRKLKANNFPFVTKITYFETSFLSAASFNNFSPPVFTNGNIMSSTFQKNNKLFPLYFLVSLFYIIAVYFPNLFKPDQTCFVLYFQASVITL